MDLQSTAKSGVLTRDEARARAELISNVAYEVALDLTSGEETFGCNATITFDAAEAGASTFIDLVAGSFTSIELNGKQLPLDMVDGARVTLPSLLSTNMLRISADCVYSHTGNGMHMFRDPIDKNVYLYTDFEPREAHRVYPCFDQPDIKATFTLSVHAHAGWTVISNTAASERPPGNESGTWVFPATKRLSTYITAIIAGPYTVFRDRHNDIDLGIYCRESLAQYMDAGEIFEVTKQGFDFFENLFAFPYAFGKYDQLFVPEYNSGAMENAGAITFNEQYVFRSKVTQAAYESRAQTVLHEMAHMWFGDLVTMRWWDDLWLNESFATFMGHLAQERATRYTNSWVTFGKSYKLWAYNQDQLPTTHPIVADVPDTEAARTNFDGISYAKGASVLRQLVAWVGEDAFTKGVRNYFQTYQYGNAELANFLGALEEASGRDLGSWAKEWLQAAGVNTIRAVSDVDEAAGTYRTVTLEQTAHPSWPTLRSHRIRLGLYDLQGERLVLRRRVELDAVGASTVVGDLAGEKVADVLLVNEGDLTYTKIRLDRRTLTTLRDHLAKLEDPLSRSLCWNAAIDQVRDAEMPSRDFVKLVLGNIDTETDVGVVQTLLGACAMTISLYGDPANRENARLSIATKARAALASVEPGSGFQLAWTRTFIGAARTDEHLGTVRGLLEGTVEIPGLAVDTDLRWLIIQALAGLGRIDDAVIAGELERDPTDAGQRFAATARAMRPTPQAKAEAWSLIVEDPDTTLATMRALILGFARFDQSALIEPYVEKYFEALEPLWAARDIEVTITFTQGMYPDVCMSDALIARTDRYIAESDPPAPVRRFLAENRDSIARALRARAVDIAAGAAEA